MVNSLFVKCIAQPFADFFLKAGEEKNGPLAVNLFFAERPEQEISREIPKGPIRL